MNPQSQVFLYEYLKANEQTSGQENGKQPPAAPHACKLDL